MSKNNNIRLVRQNGLEKDIRIDMYRIYATVNNFLLYHFFSQNLTFRKFIIALKWNKHNYTNLFIINPRKFTFFKIFLSPQFTSFQFRVR
jgi:hypothetical protein